MLSYALSIVEKRIIAVERANSMKYILAFLFAVLAASLFAESKLISGTGLEYGEPAGPIDFIEENKENYNMWDSTTKTKDITTIVEYGSGNQPDVPELPAGNDNTDLAPDCRNNGYDTDGKNTKYLEINSGDTIVTRRVLPGDAPRTLDEAGIYADARVQFTATDIPPEPEAGVDKLLVWLYAQSGATNLMITAGSYDGDSYKGAVRYTIPTSCVQIEPNEWYRLTITMELYYYNPNENNLRSAARFKVYIDDKQMVADDGTSSFMSMVAYGEGNINYRYNEVRQLGFTGEGAVDDIIFGTETPYPLDNISYKISVGAGITGFSYATNETDWVEAEIVGGVCSITDVSYLRKTIYIGKISYADDYIPDPASPTSAKVTEDGTLALSAKGRVFRVTMEDGTSYDYSALADFSASGVVSVNGTIALMADYTLSDDEYWAFEAANVTLDLMGNTLELGAYPLYVLSGKVAITNSAANAGRIVRASGNEWLIEAYSGTLTIANADIVFDGSPIMIYPSGAKLSIKGGKFTHKPVDENGNALAPKSYAARGYDLVKDDGEEYFTLKEIPVEDEEVPADDVASTEYDDEESANAAADGIIIVAPTAAGLVEDAEKDAYSGYVRPKVVEKGDGKYVLNVVFKADKVNELQNAVDDGAVAALSAADGDNIDVAVVPGLYYTLEQGATLPPAERTTQLAPSKAEKLSFTIKRDAAQGFYRVMVTPTKPEE